MNSDDIVIQKNSALVNPGAIFLCKKRLSELGSSGDISESDYSISYKLDSNKYVGWIGDFAEYGFTHFPEKWYYNNIPLVELLNSSDQDYIGVDQTTLEAINNVTLPTNIPGELEYNKYLPRYFGTAKQEGNTTCLVILPPGYKGAYIFNGSDIDSMENYAIMEHLEISTQEHSPIHFNAAPASSSVAQLPREPRDWNAIIDDVEPTTVSWLELVGNYSTYIKTNCAVYVEFIDAVSSTYRLLKLVICPKDTGVDINFVNLGYITSNNPYKNLDKYLLREEGLVKRYENYSYNSNITLDRTSNTILTKRPKTFKEFSEPSEEDKKRYSYRKTYKRGERINFNTQETINLDGQDIDVSKTEMWESITNNNTGNIPGLDKNWKLVNFIDQEDINVKSSHVQFGDKVILKFPDITDYCIKGTLIDKTHIRIDESYNDFLESISFPEVFGVSAAGSPSSHLTGRYVRINGILESAGETYSRVRKYTHSNLEYYYEIRIQSNNNIFTYFDRRTAVVRLK